MLYGQLGQIPSLDVNATLLIFPTVQLKIVLYAVGS